MPKYIDADALLKEAKRLSGPHTGDGWSNWGVYALIERQPAAEVVPAPVHCSDCRFYDKRDGGAPGGTGWCSRPGAGCGVPAEFFCAGAERKEEK